jgi:hypothetical protein
VTECCGTISAVSKAAIETAWRVMAFLLSARVRR